MNHARIAVGRRGTGWILACLLAPLGCEAEPSPSFVPLRTITADELSTMAESPVLVDVREAAPFEDGHIAGSIWVDPGALRTTTDGVEGQVTSRQSSHDIFGEAGLHPDDPVVIVGADNGTDPSRVAWTLRYYGHDNAVSLLDGGIAAWTGAELPLQTGMVSVESADYPAGPTREQLRVDKQWVLDHLDDDAVALFDVRTTDEYDEGHIPGAVHVNWTTNVGSDGAFVDDDDVRRLHGDTRATTLVTYCRTGSRAAVSWALLRRAGYDDVRLYDGSWTEWNLDPDTPKEK